MSPDMTHENIIAFWFEEIEPKSWWEKNNAFDAQIATRFKDVHHAATQCELYHWRATPLGRLAEIIVLDQFSRNIYRDQPLAFASDPLALALAQEAIAGAAHAQLNAQQKSFMYMPFMHSESPAIHKIAVELYGESGLEHNLDFELAHKAIIDRFGRYPHRNRILGRASTEQELEFLKTPGSSF